MAKKMTCKEFKEALNAVGMDFEVWGWEGILNQLVLAEKHSADDMNSRGLVHAGSANQRRADAMHDILKQRGFYDHN